jgi:hypothetical protein
VVPKRQAFSVNLQTYLLSLNILLLLILVLEQIISRNFVSLKFSINVGHHFIVVYAVNSFKIISKPYRNETVTRILSSVCFLLTRAYKMVQNTLHYRNPKTKHVYFIRFQFRISAVVNGAPTTRVPAAPSYGCLDLTIKT